jgi:hypothetical protein
MTDDTGEGRPPRHSGQGCGRRPRSWCGNFWSAPGSVGFGSVATSSFAFSSCLRRAVGQSGRARARVTEAERGGEVAEGVTTPVGDVRLLDAGEPLRELQHRGVVEGLRGDPTTHGPGRDDDGGHPEAAADRQPLDGLGLRRDVVGAGGREVVRLGSLSACFGMGCQGRAVNFAATVRKGVDRAVTGTIRAWPGCCQTLGGRRPSMSRPGRGRRCGIRFPFAKFTGSRVGPPHETRPRRSGAPVPRRDFLGAAGRRSRRRRPRPPGHGGGARCRRGGGRRPAQDGGAAGTAGTGRRRCPRRAARPARR